MMLCGTHSPVFFIANRPHRLENWTLLYFEIGPKSKDTIALRSDHAKGLIDLRDTECVRSVPEQPLCFQLKCAQRTYDLKAPTAADQSAWMSVLQVFQNYAQTIQSNRGTRPTMAVPDVYANALLRCIDHLEAYGMPQSLWWATCSVVYAVFLQVRNLPVFFASVHPQRRSMYWLYIC